MSVTCQALSAAALLSVLAFRPGDRAILKEEDLRTLGFLAKDQRDFPKESSWQKGSGARRGLGRFCPCSAEQPQLGPSSRTGSSPFAQKKALGGGQWPPEPPNRRKPGSLWK